MSQSFIILDVNGFAGQLVKYSEAFCQTQLKSLQKPAYTARRQRLQSVLHHTPLVPFDLARAYRYMSCLVEDILQAWMVFEEVTDKSQAIARLLFNNPGLLVNEQHLELTHAFRSTPTVDVIFAELDRQLYTHLGDNRWQEWTAYHHGTMLAISAGRDHRIVEWERLTGNITEGTNYSISLLNMAGYIQGEMIRYFGEQSRLLDLRPIIMDAIRRRFPRIEFGHEFSAATQEVQYVFGQSPIINYELLYCLGVQSYEGFYERFVASVFDAFVALYLHARLDTAAHYTANITQNYTLELTLIQTHVKDLPKTAIAELAEAYMRGDYLPPQERRLAEEYVLSLNH